MPDNPARELYRQAGFRRVAVVEGSWIMVLRLTAATLSGAIPPTSVDGG
jgi:hypothetical protein